MVYFGVPTCPYCKKRVNLIRTWSLKRQGEYKCPHCGGISNIFLSPLIHVFAVLAVFSGGAMYFFHKFILDDIALDTVWQILIPFAAFFLISLFMVYLAKPVIKKVSRTEMEKKPRGRSNFEDRRPAAANTSGQMFYDPNEYLPQGDYRTGPLPKMEDDSDMRVVPSSPRLDAGSYQQEMQKTSVVKLPPARSARASAPSQRPPQRPAATRSVQQPVRAQGQTSSARPAASARPVSPQPNVSSAVQGTAAPAAASSHRVVSSIDIPSVSDDFFAKYDDPDYVERRLKEIKDQRREEK